MLVLSVDFFSNRRARGAGMGDNLRHAVSGIPQYPCQDGAAHSSAVEDSKDAVGHKEARQATGIRPGQSAEHQLLR
jgi:hypothetical protein